MSLIARSATTDDVDAIVAMAEAARPALTNLPADRARLSARLASSQAALFATIERPGDEQYVLVAETDEGEIIATATIKAQAGAREAYYTYRRETLIHASQQLDVRREVDILSISHEMSHASLLCALATTDHACADHARQLLRAARLALIARFPERFAPTVFVALSGYRDAGRTPFWDGVGRHFFSRDFDDIHRAASLGSRSFIGEVMPPFPLYLPLLDDQARSAIGRVGDNHASALDVWQQEGFALSRHVDLLDGGPLLEASRNHLPRGQWLTVQIGERPGEGRPGEGRCAESLLIASQRTGDFRARIVTKTINERGQCVLDAASARALAVAADEPVLVLPVGQAGNTEALSC
ncbi:arginine N-succinyltransferase subunit alpha [Kushneria pakistanensis]|uniref:Arginine N-succinyltransferase subunit alpha n=1 Tax=Kushneria pakistanensis TaxID=1508770 RepID=A0ABQ3F905_9GAMM|nr:arginine N-succinyltransferase [Kushneria pakistanensis]GHC14574.1 arginine N-succinyltransferase subunit alpha [Kushneria pakistanensis]